MALASHSLMMWFDSSCRLLLGPLYLVVVKLSNSKRRVVDKAGQTIRATGRKSADLAAKVKTPTSRRSSSSTTRRNTHICSASLWAVRWKVRLLIGFTPGLLQVRQTYTDAQMGEDLLGEGWLRTGLILSASSGAYKRKCSLSVRSLQPASSVWNRMIAFCTALQCFAHVSLDVERPSFARWIRAYCRSSKLRRLSRQTQRNDRS